MLNDLQERQLEHIVWIPEKVTLITLLLFNVTFLYFTPSVETQLVTNRTLTSQ